MSPRVRGPAAAALVALAVLVGAYGFTPGVDRAVGDQDALVFRNFHDRETLGGAPYRWSKGGNRREERSSTLVLPQVGVGKGSLQLDVWTLEARPPVPLTLTARGETLLVTEVQGRRTLSVTLPGQAGGDIEVLFATPAWTRGKDPRSRGVAIERFTWTPAGWTLPPPRQLWLIPLLAAALAMLLARLRAVPRIATAVAASVGALVALAAGWRPLEVAPFTHRLLAIVLLAHAALLLWSALLRRPERPWWTLPEKADAAAVLLLMALSYTCVLGYHALLCWETRGFCPPMATMAGGLVVSLGLVVIAKVVATSRRRELALALVAAAGIAVAVAGGARAIHRPAVDFVTLWTAARSSLHGASFYRPADVVANHFGAVFKVPPFYGMLLLPYGSLAVQTALSLHRALGVGLYVAGAAILVRLLRPSVGGWLALAAVAVVMGLMQPSFDTLAYGQIDIVLLFLMISALLALRAESPMLAGLAIAVAGLLKLYPLVLVVFLAVRREWKGLAWTAGWLVALNVLSIGVVGWSEHVVYALQILPAIGGGTGWVENQTVNGFLSRLLVGAHRPEPVDDRAVDLLTAGAFLAVIAFSAWAASRSSERRSSLFALQFGVFLVAMVIAVPAAWIHYETVTILTFLVLVWHAADAPPGPGAALAAAAGFGLVAYGNQWSFYDGSPRPGLTVLALSREFYGLALLWATAALSAIKASSSPLSRARISS